MGTPTLWMLVGISYPHPSMFFRKILGIWYLSSISVNVSAEAGTRMPLVVTLCRSRKAGAEVLPSVPSSIEARLRLRFACEDKSEPWSEPSSSNSLCLCLALEDTKVASRLEDEGVDLVFSLRAYLKKSSASGSSLSPFFTDLTPLLVEEEPFYRGRLTDNMFLAKCQTNSEEFNICLEPVLVETCPSSGKYMESLH